MTPGEETRFDWLEIRRAGAPIEIARTESIEVHLLSAHDGTEVMKIFMKPQSHFGLAPQQGWTALEFLLVLQGRLRWLRPDGDMVLEPGDHIAGKPVEEQCMFLAEDQTIFVYVSSQPVFHHFSQQIRTLMEMAVAVEVKDGYTHDHCKRIRRMAVGLGASLGLTTPRMHLLSFGAFLHDLGKVGIPESILGKPGGLTDDEWKVVKTHPTVGRQMLEATFIKEAGPIVEQHHERLDGSGYPRGLTGDQILLEAQIVAVVDTYDAITSDRVYRKGRSKEEAFAELRREAGHKLRADVVESFIKWDTCELSLR